MRKKNYLKHLAAGLFALTMTVSLAAPVQLSAAFVSGSKPKLNSNPVYITDANGKKTGIKTFSIGPYTYNNLSVDKDITSTPTVELTTETQRKIVSKYLMPQWSAIAAELFQDQADQLVTIKGTGMMSRNVNERNSFDRQFNYKRAGVPQVYNEDDVWAVPDLAAALASKDAFTAGKRMKDYRHYTGLVSISSLKEARRLMGQELRNAADDDDNTVDDFLGNDYDKSKGEYRLPDLQKDTRGGFASVVTSIYTMASNDYDYVTFGLAFYDIDISPIAADGLDYIAAAQDYEKEENPLKAAAEHGVHGVTYSETNDHKVTTELTNNSIYNNTHTASLENKIEEEVKARLATSYDWGMEQQVGLDLNFGLCSGHVDTVPQTTIHSKLSFKELWKTSKSNETVKTTSDGKSLETKVEMPAHTYAKLEQNTDAVNYGEDIQQPVVINYKVAIFAMSGDYYNGAVGGIKPSRYDKQWMSVLFEDTDGAGACGCAGQGNLYNRAVVNKDVKDYDKTMGNYKSWCDKNTWNKRTDIDWAAIDERLAGDTRDSHTFKDEKGKERDLKSIASQLLLCEKASTISGSRKTMSSMVSNLQPLYNLDHISLKDRNDSYDLDFGSPLYLKTLALQAYDKYSVEFYGFDPDCGTWVICDKNGQEKAASDTNPATLEGDKINPKEGVSQGQNDTMYLKWKLKENTTITTKESPDGMDISKVATPLVRIHVRNSSLENPSLEIDGSYEGLYTDKINLNRNFSTIIHDKTGKEINVPYYWESRELNGIETKEDGDTSFSKPGSYHVRAYVYDNNHVKCCSDWKSITVTGIPVLKRISFEPGEMTEEETCLSKTRQELVYDLDSYIHCYDQYGKAWTGTVPEITFAISGQEDGAVLRGHNLLVDEAGTYTIAARAEGYEIDPLILKVTEENWLEEIVVGDPPLSKNELTLSSPGDAIKINLKDLVRYYDQNGDEWDGDKPTVKFSLAQDTDYAKISKGYFIASSSGTFTIEASAGDYDIAPIEITVYSNPVLKIRTLDITMNLEDPEETGQLELDRLIVAENQFGDLWKGKVPDLKFTLAEGTKNAEIKDIELPALESDEDEENGAAARTAFCCLTPGTYTIHVEPVKADSYTGSIDDIVIKVKKTRHFHDGYLDLEEISKEARTITSVEGNPSYPKINLKDYLVLSDQYEDPIGDNDSLAEGSAEEVKDLVIFSVFPDGGEDEDAFSLSQGQLVFHKAGRYTIVSEYVSGYDGVNRMRITGISIEEGRSIDQEKKAAIEQLNNYKSADLYREPQKQALADAIANGVETIQKAETPEEVDKALAAAKAEIDKIKTNAQLTEEEATTLAAAKEKARTELEGYKKADAYRDEQKTQLAAAIEKGKEEIDKADSPETVQAKLEEAKAEIDKIKTDADLTEEETISAAENLEAKQAAARNILQSYKSADLYRDPEKALFEQALEAGLEAISKADSQEAVMKALEAAEDTIDAIKTAADYEKEEQALQSAKEEAKQELAEYKKDVSYLEEEQEAFANAKSSGSQAIEEAVDSQAVEKALSDAKAEIDKIKTAAQYQEEEELEQAKDEALAQLDKYKMEDYREAEQKELAASIETGRNAIDQAKDVKSVNRALTAARASIARLKTAAAYEAEEAAKQAEQEASLRQSKKEAEDQLDSYKKEEVYRADQQVELDQARKAGKEAIAAAETEEQVREALSKAQKAMDQIKTDAQLSKEESAKAQEEAAKSAQEAEEKAKKEKEEAGPSLSSHEALVKKVRTEDDLPGSGFLPLKARQKKARKNSITIQWDKVSGASGYIVYGTKCGQKKTFKRLADTGKCSYTQKKLKKGSYHKYMVAAYKVIGGEKRVISTSKVIYIAAAGGKAGNHKTIKLKKKQLKLKKGKTVKIAASLIAESAKKPVKKYRGKRYESSNTQIASVSGKGTVKGKNKGVCYIYVLAQNGLFKKVKVTVQ